MILHHQLRYNVGLYLIALTLLLSMTVEWFDVWKIMGSYAIATFLGLLQGHWGLYQQGKQGRRETALNIVLGTLMIAPAAAAATWAGYTWIPRLFDLWLT